MPGASNALRFVCVVLISSIVTACGGAKVLKEESRQAVSVQAPLSQVEGNGVNVTLDWVLVRNSPGSWVSNADWDEYQLRVINRGDTPVTVVNATLFDSLGTPLASMADRSQLIKGSKESTDRFKDQGLDVRAGWSEGTLLVAGTASMLAGASLGVAALTGGSAATAGVAVGALLLAPVMAVGGIVRGVNNRKVSREIAVRHTAFPLSVEPQHPQRLDLFFPLAPSPQRLELHLETEQGGRQVAIIDTSEILRGLHLAPRSDQAEK